MEDGNWLKRARIALKWTRDEAMKRLEFEKFMDYYNAEMDEHLKFDLDSPLVRALERSGATFQMDGNGQIEKIFARYVVEASVYASAKHDGCEVIQRRCVSGENDERIFEIRLTDDHGSSTLTLTTQQWYHLMSAVKAMRKVM